MFYKYTSEDKKALKKTIEMWKWLAKTGSQKSTYFREHPKKRPVPIDECYLCSQLACKQCYCDNCFYTAYGNWEYAKNEKERKRFAQQFVDELKGFVNQKTKTSRKYK